MAVPCKHTASTCANLSCLDISKQDSVMVNVDSKQLRFPRNLERASLNHSSDTHETPYDRVKRCREGKINIKASKLVNVDVFTQNNGHVPNAATPNVFIEDFGKLRINRLRPVFPSREEENHARKLPFSAVNWDYFDEGREGRHDGNTARLARRSDEALGVRVSVARIAPSLLDLGRADARPRSRSEGAIRATLTRTPSASSLLRARRASIFVLTLYRNHLPKFVGLIENHSVYSRCWPSFPFGGCVCFPPCLSKHRSSSGVLEADPAPRSNRDFLEKQVALPETASHVIAGDNIACLFIGQSEVCSSQIETKTRFFVGRVWHKENFRPEERWCSKEVVVFIDVTITGPKDPVGRNSAIAGGVCPFDVCPKKKGRDLAEPQSRAHAVRNYSPNPLKGVRDEVSTFEINLRKMSLPLPAYILTGAPSDMRPVKLVTMEEPTGVKSCEYGAAPECKCGGKGRSPRKPAVTVPTCGNLRIESDLPWNSEIHSPEARALAAAPPQPPRRVCNYTARSRNGAHGFRNELLKWVLFIIISRRVSQHHYAAASGPWAGLRRRKELVISPKVPFNLLCPVAPTPSPIPYQTGSLFRTRIRPARNSNGATVFPRRSQVRSQIEFRTAMVQPGLSPRDAARAAGRQNCRSIPIRCPSSRGSKASWPMSVSLETTPTGLRYVCYSVFLISSHFRREYVFKFATAVGGNPENPMTTKSGDTVWHCSSESIAYIPNSITPLDCQRIKESVTLSKDYEASRLMGLGRECRNFWVRFAASHNFRTPVHNVCSVVVTPLDSRRATSCGYNSSHPVWHALYECLQDIHGDSSPFLL
ncbi:hypothetical protein PR048_023885 [Dryococelus australis]|uniref:Uncharacterized protein n=1 Tax=Dryococelus australis TaxID=614101 RepID=A0ABQ9GVE5_9NEOP|nr:hypothetical protein PR048_023885 [Dryococelus australis]